MLIGPSCVPCQGCRTGKEEKHGNGRNNIRVTGKVVPDGFDDGCDPETQETHHQSAACGRVGGLAKLVSYLPHGRRVGQCGVASPQHETARRRVMGLPPPYGISVLMAQPCDLFRRPPGAVHPDLDFRAAVEGTDDVPLSAGALVLCTDEIRVSKDGYADDTCHGGEEYEEIYHLGLYPAACCVAAASLSLPFSQACLKAMPR